MQDVHCVFKLCRYDNELVLNFRNDKELVSADAARGMPVDVYIGGKEHAVLHMYFARLGVLIDH